MTSSMGQYYKITAGGGDEARSFCPLLKELSYRLSTGVLLMSKANTWGEGKSKQCLARRAQFEGRGLKRTEEINVI